MYVYHTEQYAPRLTGANPSTSSKPHGYLPDPSRIPLGESQKQMRRFSLRLPGPHTLPSRTDGTLIRHGGLNQKSLSRHGLRKRLEPKWLESKFLEPKWFVFGPRALGRGPRAPGPEPRAPSPGTHAPSPEPRTPDPGLRAPGPGLRAPGPGPGPGATATPGTGPGPCPWWTRLSCNSCAMGKDKPGDADRRAAATDGGGPQAVEGGASEGGTGEFTRNDRGGTPDMEIRNLGRKT